MEAYYGGSADSVRSAHPDGLYPIPYRLSPLLPLLSPDSAKCFVERNGALVFATSKEAMAVYQKSMKTTGNLPQNRYYPFVNEAVASSSTLNWVMINDGNSTYWSSQLSDKGKSSNFGKDLRIFSLSCDAMEEEQHLVPVNLYLLF